MAAQQLLLPFRPVINLKGGLEAGATLDVYLSGTSTRTNIYSDATLTSPLSNPLTANGFGVFPAVYYNDNIDIRVVVKEADGTVIADQDPYLGDAVPGAAGQVGFDQSINYPQGTVGSSLKRFINASQPPYNIQMNDTDETSKWQDLFGDLTDGAIVLLPSGKSRISSTLALGNGTNTTRSTINSVTFVCPPPAHPVAFIDTGSGLPKSGCILEWYGAANGTMMEINGPITGIRILGAIQLDGRNLAGYGLRAFSFSNCDFDFLCAYKCTIANIDLDARNATLITGDAGGLTSAYNRIGFIHSFCHETVGAIALRLDGYEVVNGQDVTITKIESALLGYMGNRGKGLWLGYTDFVGFGRCITIPYGSLVGVGDPDPSLRPAAMYLDGSSNPFEAPTTVEFDWFAANGGDTVRGGTAGQVYIRNLSLDEGGTLPSGVSGLNIQRVHSKDAAFNGQTRGTFQRPTVSAAGDGDGWYLRDFSNNVIAAIQRAGAGLLISSAAQIELEPISHIVSQRLRSSTSYANDAAAASGGVPVGAFYRNGSAIQIRIA